MESIVSYPDRGTYGKNSYRGNCSGRLIEDLIAQYRLQGLSDFMVGSGTTEDVVREKGLRGSFADLNRGFDMMSMDIPERAENIFWHPPYHNMIVYSGQQFSDAEVLSRYGFDPKAGDLSRCKDWEEFVQRMNYCMLKQFAALEKGGRMFTLVGDMKKSGRLFSMILDLVKPGTTENIIIKAQHNTWSGRQSYSGSFVPIVHEYLLVTRKDAGIIIPVSFSVRKDYDMRTFSGQSWRDLVLETVRDNGGKMTLSQLYEALADSGKSRRNEHWQEKIRQTVQNAKYFTRTDRGEYALAA